MPRHETGHAKPTVAPIAPVGLPVDEEEGNLSHSTSSNGSLDPTFPGSGWTPQSAVHRSEKAAWDYEGSHSTDEEIRKLVITKHGSYPAPPTMRPLTIQGHAYESQTPYTAFTTTHHPPGAGYTDITTVYQVSTPPLPSSSLPLLVFASS